LLAWSEEGGVTGFFIETKGHVGEGQGPITKQGTVCHEILDDSDEETLGAPGRVRSDEDHPPEPGVPQEGWEGVEGTPCPLPNVSHDALRGSGYIGSARPQDVTPSFELMQC